MGVGIEQFRLKIGLFDLKCKVHIKCSKDGRYSPYQPGSDVHFRSFLCGLILVGICSLTHCLLYCHDAIVNHYADPFSPGCTYVSVPAPGGSETLVTPCLAYSNQYAAYSSSRLLLSSDVELNPGPTEDTALLLNAIQDVKNEVLDVKSEVKQIKSDVKLK